VKGRLGEERARERVTKRVRVQNRYFQAADMGIRRSSAWERKGR